MSGVGDISPRSLGSVGGLGSVVPEFGIPSEASTGKSNAPVAKQALTIDTQVWTQAKTKCDKAYSGSLGELKLGLSKAFGCAGAQAMNLIGRLQKDSTNETFQKLCDPRQTSFDVYKEVKIYVSDDVKETITETRKAVNEEIIMDRDYALVQKGIAIGTGGLAGSCGINPHAGAGAGQLLGALLLR